MGSALTIRNNVKHKFISIILVIILLSVFFFIGFEYVEADEEDHTPPSITINFAGNLTDSGGPYWKPPGESTILDIGSQGNWRNGYYTNDSKQHENYIYINLTITDAGTGVNNNQVWLQWLNETSWTNWTYNFIHTEDNYFEIITSTAGIPVQEGYKYSFNIVANDTSNNSQTIWWNKTGLGGDYTRRYIQLNCTNQNITYNPYYFYDIGYSSTDINKKDRLNHDQGADGSIYDTGCLLDDIPSNAVSFAHCGFFIGYWFDNSTCIEPFTLDNIYYHFWWSTDDGEIPWAGWKKTRAELSSGSTNSYTTNTDNCKSEIYYNNGFSGHNNTYSLDTNLLTVTNTSFTDNNIYELSITMGTMGTYPSAISNRSFISFVIFNVPDNTTLNNLDSDADNLSDLEELYYTYTSPFLLDTDNDGINDYWENQSGSDPNNYTDTYDIGGNANNSPVLSNELPSNNSKSVDIYQSTINITIEDPEGDLIYWTIEGLYTNNTGQTNDINGTKTANLDTPLPYDTIIIWYVNTTDGFNWTNVTFHFTTRSAYIPNLPDVFSVIAQSRFQINLSWSNDNKADSTRIEWYNSEDDSWNIGDHNLLYNGSYQSTSHPGLNPGTTYYYKAWSWNFTDNVWSNGSNVNATTNYNNAPSIGIVSPNNGSIVKDLSLIWNVSITDYDNDNFNWIIECSNEQFNNSNDDSNGTKQLLLSGLNYNTEYIVWVNVSDIYDTTTEWFNFTTRNQYIPNPPSSFSADTVNQTKINITWLHGSHSDKVYIRYDTSSYPADRNSGIFLCNESGIIKIVEDLSFGAQYFFRAWAWNDTDSCWSSSTSDDTNTTDSNTAPAIENANPVNESLEQELSLTWSISISDYNSDSFDWTIECSNGQSSNGNGETDGIKELSICGLDHSTLYTIWVNATDGYTITKEWFTFTTRDELVPQAPISLNVSSNGRFQIDISWTNSANTDYTLVEWRTISGSWTRGEGTELYNGTGTSTLQSGLDPGTTMYYQAWSWNGTDNIWSNVSSDNATTDSNTIPTLASEGPINESTNISIFTSSLLVSISDGDSDSFDWNIETSPDIGSNSGNDEGNGVKTCVISGLNYNTTYYWFVNASDGYDSISEFYWFTTSVALENNAPLFSSISPSNKSTGVSISTMYISLNIDDLDGDTFIWTIETSPNIGNNSENNASNGSKYCSISGLNYSTTYYWFVNATDGNASTNEYYYFTTASAPSYPPPSPPPLPIPPLNNPPTADTGGPYNGLLNENIEFDGSKSTDSDGDIVSYSWDFGDGNIGNSKTVNHTFEAAGNYSITLTVTDDDSATDTDTTYIIIVQVNQNETENISKNKSKTNLNDSKNDSDIDGIPDIIEEKLGSDANDSSDIIKIIINDIIHFLIDTDKDGQVDLYYNPIIEIYSTLGNVGDVIYLIDFDGDGDWDYTYNFANFYLSKYDILSTEESKLNLVFEIMLIIIILIITIIYPIIYFKDSITLFIINLKISILKRDYYLISLKPYMKHFCFKRDHIHFFTKNDKKPPLSKNMKGKYEDFQDYYIEDAKKDIEKEKYLPSEKSGEMHNEFMINELLEKSLIPEESITDEDITDSILFVEKENMSKHFTISRIHEEVDKIIKQKEEFFNLSQDSKTNRL